MSSGADRAVNEARALALVEEAARRGAELIGLPEMWEHIGPASAKTFAADVQGEQLRPLRALCEKLRIVCLAGSIAERAADGRIYNASALIGRSGEILAVYRKLHLFDVDIPGGARRGWGSGGGGAAVEVDGLAGHPRRFVGREIRARSADVLG